MKNRSLLLFAFIFIAIFLFVFFGIPYQDRKVSSEFHEFYSNKIEGIIIDVEKLSRSSAFKINNSALSFNWFPYTNKSLNENEIFSRFASVGDSVFKAAYSDTLILFKNGKEYKYTFQKFE